MPIRVRQALVQAELRQPRFPKPHIMRGRDGYWYHVDVAPGRGRITWRQRAPITGRRPSSVEIDERVRRLFQWPATVIGRDRRASEPPFQ